MNENASGQERKGQDGKGDFLNHQNFNIFFKASLLIVMLFFSYTAHQYVNADRYGLEFDNYRIVIYNTKNGNAKTYHLLHDEDTGRGYIDHEKGELRFDPVK